MGNGGRRGKQTSKHEGREGGNIEGWRRLEIGRLGGSNAAGDWRDTDSGLHASR